jgi:hypothetical protein
MLDLWYALTITEVVYSSRNIGKIFALTNTMKGGYDEGQELLLLQQGRGSVAPPA